MADPMHPEISSANVAFYDEHGRFATPRVLNDEILEEALAGMEEHWTGHRDRVLPASSIRA